jgi:hypothetical protein
VTAAGAGQVVLVGHRGTTRSTRSEIATSQNNAALRSMFELKGMESEPVAELYFGPTAPGRKRKAVGQDDPPAVDGLCTSASTVPSNPAFDGS